MEGMKLLPRARRRRLSSTENEMLAVLKDCLLLFSKDHALDRFHWGHSALRAQDIRELNELPLKLRATIAKMERHGNQAT